MLVNEEKLGVIYLRKDGRGDNELRELKIERDYLIHPHGSVLIELGNTKIICTAMIEDRVPFFLKGQNKGWLTAEYSMLPGSTKTRKVRDISRGKLDGRSQEIQRLIGRSLRTVIDLDKIGERTIWVDCDVIQADGGTRTAAISGAYLAVVDAINTLDLKKNPIKDYLAAVSVGIIENRQVLDMCYEEDYRASVDMNIVMTGEGKLIEIQGTGEEESFSLEELNSMLSLASKGIEEIVDYQKKLLEEI